MSENREYVVRPGERGNINISEDVIAAIAANAAQETEGVASMPSSLGKEMAEMFGRKSLPRGVRVTAVESNVIVDVCITVHYGSPVGTVGEAVQKNVLAAIEGMTGFTASTVNVHVCGVAMDR